MTARGLTIKNSSITLCVDQLGLKYELPPYVINEPLAYGQIKQIESAPLGNRKTITVTVRSSKRPDVRLAICTHDTGEVLRTAYVTKTKATESIRLFFNGVEIKGESYLGRLEEGVVVQALG